MHEEEGETEEGESDYGEDTEESLTFIAPIPANHSRVVPSISKSSDPDTDLDPKTKIIRTFRSSQNYSNSELTRIVDVSNEQN
jgi:hypothetical protein